MQRAIVSFYSILCICIAHAQNSNSDSLINELKNAKPDTNKVHLLRNIGVSLAHRDPQEAIGYWKEGVTLSKSLNFDVGLARNYINIATGYSFAGKYDSSLIYSDSAIFYCQKTKDISRLALSYLNRADTYMNLQDFKQSLLHCDTALRYAEQTGNIDRRARIYDIIADVYAKQLQFEPAIFNLNKALELYKKDENAIMEGQVYSDFADMYKDMGKHDSAIIFYKAAIRIGESAEDIKNLSTYHADLGGLYIAQEKYKEAEGNILKSLEYARIQENNLQLATAYSRLCNLYIKQKKYIEAIDAGKRAYQFAIAENHRLHQQEASALLAEAYTGAQDYQNAYRYLSISKNLNDSIILQHYNEEIAGLQTSFEVREKDKEILLLSKEKELQQQRLSRQRVLIAGSVILIILSIIGIILFINRSRMRNRMKELELRNQIAADLHDEVGSSLNSIHMLSQIATQKNDASTSQQEIMSRVSSNAKETMEKMGDIVWMIKPGEREGAGLVQRMQRFMYEMCGESDIESGFDAGALETAKLNMQQRKNVYLIFKEALNNAVKYSKATKINVTTSSANKELELLIEDNGRGFNVNEKAKGNGLGNMINRAKELGGKLDISSTNNMGTSIKLVMPVS
jgi:two-component system, NarL family, sensor histidine kinase UhpB